MLDEKKKLSGQSLFRKSRMFNDKSKFKAVIYFVLSETFTEQNQMKQSPPSILKQTGNFCKHVYRESNMLAVIADVNWQNIGLYSLRNRGNKMCQ